MTPARTARSARGVSNASVVPFDRAVAIARLDHACFELITAHPFFASLLLGLERIEDPTAPTMWTDGTRLGYNLAFVHSLTGAEVLGVLVHEVIHVVCLHPFRGGDRDPFRWNVACDHVTNAIVADGKFTLPAGALPPIHNTSAEALYETLPPSQAPQAAGQGGLADDLRPPVNTDGQPLYGAPLEEAIANAQVRIRQARTAAEQAGTLPAWLARLVSASTEPTVSWPAVLAQFLDQQARADYSFTHSNRRFANTGVIMPGRHSLAYGEVILACDTSGSIDDAQLAAIIAEVQGCLAAYADNGQEVPVTIAWFDHAVTSQLLDSWDPTCRPVGGGGTSYRVVMEWLAARQEAPPRALLVITDGACDDFGEAPDVPVLWFLSRRDVEFAPPYGTIAGVLADPPAPDR